MAMMGGRQANLQNRAQTGLPFSPNNGNPGGVNNSKIGVATPPSTDRAMPSWARRNQQMPTDRVDYNGQHPDLGRYVAPQLDAAGNPVSRDRSPYAYNLPNSYGSPFDYRRNRQQLGSAFNPTRQNVDGGGGSTSDPYERLRQSGRAPGADSSFGYIQMLMELMNNPRPASGMAPTKPLQVGRPDLQPGGSLGGNPGPQQNTDFVDRLMPNSPVPYGVI